MKVHAQCLFLHYNSSSSPSVTRFLIFPSSKCDFHNSYAPLYSSVFLHPFSFFPGCLPSLDRVALSLQALFFLLVESYCSTVLPSRDAPFLISDLGREFQDMLSFTFPPPTWFSTPGLPLPLTPLLGDHHSLFFSCPTWATPGLDFLFLLPVAIQKTGVGYNCSHCREHFPESPLIFAFQGFFRSPVLFRGEIFYPRIRKLS